MRYRFEECLERGKIITIPVDPVLVEKELHEAAADLAAAERSLADHNEKWAIIQAYYSQFHSERTRIAAGRVTSRIAAHFFEDFGKLRFLRGKGLFLSRENYPYKAFWLAKVGFGGLVGSG